MSIVSHRIISVSVQADERKRVQYGFTDHLAIEHFWNRGTVDGALDLDADRVATIPQVETYLANQEVSDAVTLAENWQSPEKVAEHQSQADFDRRVLSRIMMMLDAHAVNAAYPMFQAMELRGGANANQRATYLGVTNDIYGQIDGRFSNVNGVAWFLDDEKNQRWEIMPEGLD